MYLLLPLLALLWLPLALGAQTPVMELEEPELQARMRLQFGVLRDQPIYAEPATQAQIELGRQLFLDPRLSLDDSISCHSCHPISNGRAGMDSLPRSPGIRGQLGQRNSPTVFNSAYTNLLFWDGRADSLESQAQGPLLHPAEMGMPSPQALEQKLAAIPKYRAAFQQAFPDDPAIRFARVLEALAAFERTLVTTDRFDDYLSGDLDALTPREKRGMQTFVAIGCAQCHTNALLGGTTREDLGLKHPFPNQNDSGYFQIEPKPWNRMKFKSCSLRNVALTAPYFHDGSAATLEEAVRTMAWIQLDKRLSDEEVDLIVAFLNSLSGKGLTGP